MPLAEVSKKIKIVQGKKPFAPPPCPKQRRATNSCRSGRTPPAMTVCPCRCEVLLPPTPGIVLGRLKQLYSTLMSPITCPSPRGARQEPGKGKL
ncbi:hypothetical protein GWK47_014494 [Chionoecetes opilio]|uniref:Uncharacterized protein n=1 Tax=Chionoecetes opilio TaxID=41210 RepID=A0A8J4XX05_CHIOP|nr:hypothetical protein GWK47_014494 [Chionoecetes opilio]